MAPFKKKRKIGKKPNGLSKKQGGLASAIPREFHSLDWLQWKNISFPEQLEDAGGFLGLEEVSDVEVTKDKVSGRVSYGLPSGKMSDGSDKHKAQRHRDPALVLSKVKNENEDDWHGFSDNPNLALTSSENENLIFPNERLSKGISQTSEIGKQNAISEQTASSNFELLRDIKENYTDVSAWRDLGLSEEIMTSLARMKFTHPTTIQREAIPEIIRGHDVIGKASTGSGKTLAFGIPIYEFILGHETTSRSAKQANFQAQTRAPTALIISPTRELAHQLLGHMTDLCGTVDGPVIVALTGGMSKYKQQRVLVKADIIVATPGRLWEMMEGDLEFSKRLQDISFLVLDEADRLLSEGHFKEVAEILNALDRNMGGENVGNDKDPIEMMRKRRQTLIFSATFQKDLHQKLTGKSRHLANELMSQRDSIEYLLTKINFQEEKPKFINSNPKSQVADKLTECILECPAIEKDLYLYTLLLHHVNSRILIFVNSISSVRRITPFLQNLSFQAYALHSHMLQKARLRAVERFSSTSAPSTILVATDVAARGLDIPLVQFVLHYHVPRTADVYIHRSGRTARAGFSGSSILLSAPEEAQGVRRLVAKVHAQTAINILEDSKHSIGTIELDRRVVSRVKHRVALSKKIADASLAKEKNEHEDKWLKTAAEDLGVDYDSDEFIGGPGAPKGIHKGKKYKEKEARALSKDELASLRGQLKDELKNRINVGVSERYLTAGGIDVDSLLAEKEQGQFLGMVGD